MGQRKHKGIITPRQVSALKPGHTLTDPAPRGGGAFEVRKLATGVAYYFRFTAPDGSRQRVPLGNDWTLAEAREEAKKYATRYQSGERDLLAALADEQREAMRAREARAKAEDADKVRQAATMGALLSAYVRQLHRDGKASASEVARAVDRNIAKPFPKLWAMPADEVQSDDVLAIVARVTDAGKLTEARKLRAYIGAAYRAAIRSRQDARSTADLRALRIRSDPARDVVAVRGAVNVRKRALSVAELRAYWRRIAEPAGGDTALLRFHLLTGAQRIEQLARLTADDFDGDTGVIRLRDTKGRRLTPREHDVPLLPEAFDAMKAMAPQRVGPFLFTVTAGETGAVYSTVQHRMRKVAEAMDAAGELEKGLFTPGDLRRTVETRLAAAGVSVDVRAQLQSHGLGGVQARHYDRHDYLAEKREALETLHRLLTGEAGTVVPLRRKGMKP
ncbi:MAG: tyrosine-type recombinase/integrase [Xanthomonadaceae bacterium]|nr:tyrosine-type recombinase/integrase [Xanthomonadaceae bacterium]